MRPTRPNGRGGVCARRKNTISHKLFNPNRHENFRPVANLLARLAQKRFHRQDKSTMKQAYFSIFLGFSLIFSIQAKPLPPFHLKDGDRVAFLGDTLI